MFDAGFGIDVGNVANFLSEERLVDAAAARLRQAGFEVLQASGAMINISGSPETYEAAFGAPLVVREETVVKEHAREDVAQFLDCPNTDLPGLIGTRGTAFADLLEGVAIEEPRYYMAANPFCAAAGLLAPERSRRRLARLQRRPCPPRGHHRQGCDRRDGRLGILPPPLLHRSRLPGRRRRARPRCIGTG